MTRLDAGAPVSNARTTPPPPPSPGNRGLAPHPVAAWIGVVGILVILWLMMLKPF